MNKLTPIRKEYEAYSVTSLEVKGLVLNEHRYKKASSAYLYSGKNPAIYFVVKGRYKVRAGGKDFVCESGCAVIIYDRNARPVEKVMKGTIVFSIELTAELLKREEAELPFLKSHVFAEDSVIHELMDNLYKEYKQHERGAEHEIEGFFLVILGLLERERVIPLDAKPVWLRRLIRYLYKNLEERVTLKSIAGLLGMNEDYLSRAVQRFYSCKFEELKMQVMLRKAKAMLRREDLTLDDVAYLCGFSHASHLIKCFKEHFKETPDRFRRFG